jgi:putative ABC transport system permease protein
MDFREQLRTAIDSIMSAKLRSLLTTLGVVIGVTAVIVLVSVGEGVRGYLADMFAGMGSNLLFVFPGKSATRGHGRSFTTVRRLTLEDARALEQRSGNIELVAPVVVGGGQVELGAAERDVLVFGTNHNYPLVHNHQPAAGQFFTEQDVSNKHRVVVIGQTVARELFGDALPLGQLIKVSEARYRVIGVMESKGQSLGFDLDDVVFIPVTGAMDLFNVEGLTRISVKTTSKYNLDPAIEDIKRILRDRHNRREDFTVVNQAEMLETFNQIADTMTWVLVGIASISLLVGGIGIMNIMLVAVRERTREIGVRKAVGARRRDILLQFLIESVCVSLIGGLLGLGLGTLIVMITAWAAPQIPAQITWWNVAVAVGFSVAVGVFFGVAPARRAAALDPIACLRYE